MATTPSSTNHRLFADFIKLALSTDEVQQMTKGVSAELLQDWSGKSRLKKWIARRLEKKLSKTMLPKDLEFQAALISFLETNNRIPDLVRQLSGGLSVPGDIVKVVLQSLDALSATEKTELAGYLIDNAALPESGPIITLLARLANDIHNESPTFFTEKLTPQFNRWLEQTDFGELREALEKSETDLVAFLSAANEALAQSPAKMVCLYSGVPILMNIGAAGVLNSLVVQNTMAPELLADILCSLIKDIKSETIALLLNEFNELSRKILTGSALLGDSGNSALVDVVAGKSVEVYQQLDFALLDRVEEMRAETREQYAAALVEASKRDPDQAVAYLRRLIRPLTAAPHTWNRHLTAVEDLLSDDQIADEVARGISETDIQELAETANRFLSMLNAVLPRLSEKGVNPMAEFVTSLDLDEVSETARMLTDETVKSLKPIAGEIMPHLIRGVTELIRPENGEQNIELESALAEFRSVLLKGETI